MDLEAFYRDVDARAADVAAQHAGRLQCRRGCSSCCVDGITVFEVEADAIRRRHAEVLASAPHPPGACAFLDGDGACRIYADRPYVCRTQGLPLRWLDDEDEGVERRDICELNDAPPGDWPPITDLSPRACYTLGPAEERLQALQREHGRRAPNAPESTELRRVRLRDLFAKR